MHPWMLLIWKSYVVFVRTRRLDHGIRAYVGAGVSLVQQDSLAMAKGGRKKDKPGRGIDVRCRLFVSLYL